MNQLCGSLDIAITGAIACVRQAIVVARQLLDGGELNQTLEVNGLTETITFESGA